MIHIIIYAFLKEECYTKRRKELQELDIYWKRRILDLNIFLEYWEAFHGLLARRRNLKA